MSKQPTILASTWRNGLFVLNDDGLKHELPNQSVRALSDDLNGGVLASVDGNALYRRSNQGEWELVAQCDGEISATFSVEGKTFVGTDDARVLQLDEQGRFHQIDTFDSIDGREAWFAGTAVIDGKEVGPPLGVRSLHGAPNGLLLANVHVGGIPRSMDYGLSWAPTIEVNLDAHQVRIDSSNPELVVAATAAGLSISHDGGMSWSVQTDGLHEPYCSAVEIVGENIFIAASESHFAPQSAIYRRSIRPGVEPLIKVAGGLPDWLDGIVDTACIASKSEQVVLITASGSVYVSSDSGNQWRKREEIISGVSSIYLL